MKKTQRFFCAQCGNRTTAQVLGVAIDTEYYGPADEEPMPYDTSYAVVKCVTCSVVQLYTYGEEDQGGLDDAVLLHPKPRSISKDVPELIAQEFAEAQKVEKISRTAFAVLIGRVLERLFKDKGARGRNLQEQIKDLSSKGIIPETLSEMAHTLRYLRNEGAHVSDYVIELDEVQAMRDFTITLLEYVYVAPAKLAAFKLTVDKKKASMIRTEGTK